MPLEIHLSEGPNVVGLSPGREALYVGFCYHGEDLIWRVIEGRKIGTPSSYRLHIGRQGNHLEEVEIIRFEYTKEKTVVDFQLKGIPGTLTFSNTSDEATYRHGALEETIDNVYNFFGDGKTGMFPSDWKDYFPDSS